ncbi:uncharacterized protein BDV17DRAFT_8868 [Aspergillus undulatus]|uniref:uncharacterized protein n=1 Tax=Aspergillus undulatus TaxID=1810928 RepID=UPI003CCDE827
MVLIALSIFGPLLISTWIGGLDIKGLVQGIWCTTLRKVRWAFRICTSRILQLRQVRRLEVSELVYWSLGPQYPR